MKQALHQLTRRHALFGAAALAACPGVSLAGRTSAVDLNWKDLRPLPARGFSTGNAVNHSSIPSRDYSDPRAYMVEKKYNGMLVRLPGYLVPLQFDGTGGTEFLLVPFVGACIHVPPPPPNQLVHAMIARPYEMEGLFEPVYAVGILNTVLAETELADTSYVMEVKRFEDVTFG